MELNNIPNDKDTTVITPMQEQIRNVPKTDVEPTTDFQVGELPKGGFTKVDAEIGTDAYGMQKDLKADELGKVTAKDAKKDVFPSGKKITYEDVDDIITHHDIERNNPNLTAAQKSDHGKVINAWKSKKVDMDKQVQKLASSILKTENLQKNFTEEDWRNIRNYYTRNHKSDNSDVMYLAIANYMVDPKAGIAFAKQLGKAANDADVDIDIANDWWLKLKAADDILRSKAAADVSLFAEFSSGVDASRKEKLEKSLEDDRKRDDERIGKLTGVEYAKELKKAGYSEDEVRTRMEEFNERNSEGRFDIDKAINAVFPKAKKPVTKEAKVETPVTNEVKAEVEKPKNAAEEKLEEKVNVSLSTADALKAVGNDVYENAQAATENLGRKAKKLNDGKDLMSNLPDFAINKLLRSEFGDLTVDKNGKKVLNSKALGTYGWFVLDNLGAALVNASQVARGMTPTQKSAYKQYLENEMVNAIGRKNKLTESINDIQLQGLVSDKELLTTIGMERIKLGSSAIDNALRAYQSDIDTARFAKLLNENAQYLSTLSDTNKQEMLKFLALQAQDVDAQARILGFMQAAALKAQLAKTDADKELAGIQVKQGNLELQMKEKDIAKATQALDIMKAELEQKYKGLKMSDLQMEQLKLAIEQDTINNKYLDAKNVMELVNDGSSAVGSIIKSIIPGAK